MQGIFVGLTKTYSEVFALLKPQTEKIGESPSLGVLFFLLALYGGFLWMTARGDTEQVQKGKDILINAITGLVIVMLAYAITRVASYFIIRATLPGALPVR